MQSITRPNCASCDSRHNQNLLSFKFQCMHLSEENPNKAGDEKFKTKLCHHFMTTGTCYYGTKCHFAHGEHELRRNDNSGPLIHPRHKTTLCQNELRHGTCKFGKGCMFIHRDDPEYENLQQKMFSHQKNLGEPKQRQVQHQMQSQGTVQAEQTTPQMTFFGLFAPLKNIVPDIQDPSIFSPGTPISRKKVSYDDRRHAAASLWGALSPRVSVWEKRLRSGSRLGI